VHHLHPHQYLLVLVRRFLCRRVYLPISAAVLHPAGNVAEHLVAAGLARVVDWHAGMLATGGGMERLRAGEKTAKEKRACLYANVPTASASITHSNGTANGHARIFDGTVIRVWSGDQISVVDKESGKERRLQLSSTKGPK
jgi:staphylococcal nuclease domain-containing protein 1